MASRPKRPTDWRKRFDAAKPAHTVLLNADFAGVKAGTVLYIATPGVIANYVSRIPPGETRTIVRMRNELARRNDAAATCPVTTAMYLRVVAEVALQDLAEGKPTESVIPFWRVVEPGDKIARRLSCDDALIAHMRALETGAAPDA